MLHASLLATRPAQYAAYLGLPVRQRSRRVQRSNNFLNRPSNRSICLILTIVGSRAKNWAYRRIPCFAGTRVDGEIRDNAAQIPRSIVTVPTPRVSQGAGMHPLLALRMVLSRSRPRDALEGLVQGIKVAGLGLVFCLVLCVSTLASAILGVRKRGILFALKCIVGGSIGTALAAVGALAAGVTQVMRGLANTPTAIRARAKDQVWDAVKGEWTDVDLTTLRKQCEADLDDEPLEDAETSGAVLETEFYDLLKVAPTASTQDLKKAYYREARKCHPDTNPDDDDAKEKFQLLAEAYKVLSDVELRKQYDREGKEAVHGTNPLNRIDPVLFFSLLFGCEAFEPWVGELELAMRADQMSKSGLLRKRRSPAASLQADMMEASTLQRRRVRREVRCASQLQLELDNWAAGLEEDFGKWEQRFRSEAAKLALEQRGPELLSVLGAAYELQAQAYLADHLKGRISMAKLVAWLKRGAQMMQLQLTTVRTLITSMRSVGGSVRSMRKLRNRDLQDTEQREHVQAAVSKSLPSLLQLGWRAVVTDVARTGRRAAQLFLLDKSTTPGIRIRRARGVLRLGRIFQEVGLEATRAQVVAANAGPTPDMRSIEEAIAGSMKANHNRKRRSASSSREQARRVD